MERMKSLCKERDNLYEKQNDLRGQKQKIALARALYHNKPILILDEATSAIDKKSAYDIEEKLLKLPGITLISITHDISSPQLKNYDKIIFVADKKVSITNPCPEFAK